MNQLRILSLSLLFIAGTWSFDYAAAQTGHPGVRHASHTTSEAPVAPNVTTFKVFDNRSSVTETFVDVGAEGFSNGDFIVEHTSLVHPETNQSVGRAVTRIQIVEALQPPSDDNPMGDAEVIVDCTIELGEGNVVFYGSGLLNRLMDGVDFPVVGGTGRYAGSRGTVRVQMTEVNGQEGVLMAFSLHEDALMASE